MQDNNQIPDLPTQFSPATDGDPTRVAIYARVSSEAQDVTNSIEAQIRACRQYAAHNNMVVVSVYVDEAETGTTANRPEFQKMVADANGPAPPFEIILVWKFSRFSRDRVDNPFYKKQLRQRGIRIVSINEPTEDSPMGQLMEGIIEEFDAYYSANLAEEVKRGQRQLVERGFYPGSKPPYGYQLKKARDEGDNAYHNILVEDPITAPIVRRIFVETLAGYTLAAIKRRFDREGIPTPLPFHKGKARSEYWSSSTLSSIVHDQTHAGFIVWGRRYKDGSPPLIRPGRHEGVVTMDEFEQAVKNVAKNAPDISNPGNAGSTYMMSGLLRCRKCDRSLVVDHSMKGKYKYYVCANRKNNNRDTCDCPRLNLDRFDDQFLVVLMDDILCPSNIKTAVAKMAEVMANPHDEQRSRAQAIAAELRDVAQQKARIMEAYERRAYNVDEYIQRTDLLREKEQELKQHLAEATSRLEPQLAIPKKPEPVLALAAKIRGLLKHASVEERKQMLQLMIKCVWVEKGAATVVYRVPLPRDAKRPAETELVMALDEPLPIFAHVSQQLRLCNR